MNATKTAVTAAITAAVVALLLIFAMPAGQHSSGPNADVLYSEIRSSGTIRAAYAVGAPLFVVDPNTGTKSGIFYDIVNAAATHLGLKVDWTNEVGYGEMIQGLQDRQYDIVGSGVWINSDRAKSADFTVPLYYDAVFAYARVGDNRFGEDLSNLDSPSFTIATMDGELGATIAESQFSRAKMLSLPQSDDFSQLILNVVNGKADIVFLSAAAAQSYQSANPNKIVAVDPNKPLRIFPNAILIPQGQFSLKEALDAALTEMQNDGEIDAILKKYSGASPAYLQVALPYETTTSK